ncbi:hypothetical protein HYQ46_004812 [Verticillium longisporum]|nr:hypothetical protein HYQ46_004812 [Verticillium longisporum]
MEARAPHGDTAHDATTAASTDGSSMGGHEMGMMVVFQNMIQTSLYSEAWTPNSVGTTGGHEMGMMVIFQNMIQTSLYSEAWTPNSVGTSHANLLIVATYIFEASPPSDTTSKASC